MDKNFNIVLVINSQSLDSSCIGSVHRLPFIQAFAHDMKGKGNVLVVTSPSRIGNSLEIKKQQENLFVFTPSLAIPFSFVDRFSWLLNISKKQIAIQLKKVFEKLNFSKNVPVVLWVTHPFHYHYFGCVNESMTIYECYDDFVVFGKDKPNKQIRNIEQKLAKNSDLVLATSQNLVDKLKEFNLNTHYFSNACDFKLFNSALSTETNLAKEMQEIPQPRIGFTGNIFHCCCDNDLLYEIMKSKPNWSFVFIGQVDKNKQKEYKKMNSLKNSFFLGWKEYATLPTYLKGLDVAIMYYKVNDTMKSVNPNKVYQFMAAGVPIVTTPIPEILPFREVVEIAENVEGFIKAIERSMTKDKKELRDKMISFAQDNSWEKRVSMVLRLIEDKIGE